MCSGDVTDGLHMPPNVCTVPTVRAGILFGANVCVQKRTRTDSMYATFGLEVLYEVVPKSAIEPGQPASTDPNRTPACIKLKAACDFPPSVLFQQARVQLQGTAYTVLCSGQWLGGCSTQYGSPGVGC